MKTAIALVIAIAFATSGAQAQTVAAPVAPVPGVLAGSGLSGAGAAVTLAGAVLVIGGVIAIVQDDDDDNDSATSTRDD